MEITKITKYTYGNAPNQVPLRAADLWNDDVVAAAGFDPDDSDVTVTDLAEDWHGHPAGSLVVTGLTCEGHPFAVVEVAEEPEPESGPTVAEAKRLIEEAVNDLGPEAHERYAGLDRTGRNQMVSEVQGGADPAAVVAWFALEAEADD